MRAGLFKNENCSFRPFATTTIGGESFPVGYKVVTQDRLSLGLRGNVGGFTPDEWRILRYDAEKWTELPDHLLVASRVDWGGIWAARTPGNARALWKYYEVKRDYGPARILVCAMKGLLFAKPDRVKCRGVYPIEEINLLR